MAFAYAAVVLLVVYPRRKRRRNTATKTMATFIACDALCVGLMIATITVLARSGVPASCHQLIKYGNKTPNCGLSLSWGSHTDLLDR